MKNTIQKQVADANVTPKYGTSRQYCNSSSLPEKHGHEIIMSVFMVRRWTSTLSSTNCSPVTAVPRHGCPAVERITRDMFGVNRIQKRDQDDGSDVGRLSA
jgi:hypothetical protein